MRLSVIVTIVDGGAALERCLRALTSQVDAPPMDVIVPWDDSVAGMPALAEGFAGVRAIAMGSVSTARPKPTPAGQHELFDRRRSVGLAAAEGEIIAILEDRGVPRSDWARNLVALHERLPHDVIGGAVANGRDATLNWAVFVCDFGRYQPPFEAGPRPYVTDVNVGYKRRALESTRDLWKDRYHETTVHWALQRAGAVLWLAPDPVVDQHRDGLRLGRLLGERFAWGRLFAYTRAREMSAVKRLAYVVMAPVLPLVLFARHARRQLTLPTRRAFVRGAPATLILLAAWSAGELMGYATGQP